MAMPTAATSVAAPASAAPPSLALRPFRLAVVAVAALCAGCLSYSPREVGAMSAYDLCEAQLYSRMNFTAETQTLVSEELRRRSEDCRAQVPAIEANREYERDDAMYGRSGP